MQNGIKKRVIWISLCFISSVLFLVGVVLAQTTTMTCTEASGDCCLSGSTTDPDCLPGTPTQPTTNNEQTNCTNASGKWCLNSDGTTGWCSYSTSPCPAYDSASCAAQSGEWCTYQSGSGGWCAISGAECPINDQATCIAKGRNWCLPSGGGTGWCNSVGMVCPAYDAASCSAQNGEWCAYTGGASGGWCSTGSSGGCPIYDQATCTAKGRSWCVYTSASGGWCATTGGTCPSDTTTITNTTTPPTPTTPTYTCSNGSVVSNSSNCPVNYDTMTWPSNETDCVKYKGVWCTNNSSGSGYYGGSTGACYMAGQKCPVMAPSGKMTCWDNSFIDTWSSCPTMPSTKADCTSKNYVWCDSTYSGSYSSYSGWCSAAGTVCTKSAPSGQMICPDNVTAVTKLSACPVAAVTPIVTYKTCPDGSSVKSDATCPKELVYKICPADNSKVLADVACPVKTEDPMSVCMAKGGIWCLDKSSGEQGYCSSVRTCKTTTVEGPIPTIPELDLKLNDRQIKFVEQKKKELIESLITLDKVFKKYNDTDSLSKTRALRERITGLGVYVEVFDTLEIIKDDISSLRTVKNDLISSGGQNGESERDEAFEKRALKQLRTKTANFLRQLAMMQKKADILKKNGFVLPVSLGELLDEGRAHTTAIKNATSFDEARDASESLADIFDDLNEWMPRLDQLSNISGILKVLDKNISKRESDLKKTRALIKRLGIDAESSLTEIETNVSATRDAFAKLKTYDYSSEEPVEYVQDAILDKLYDADAAIAGLRSLSNLRSLANKLSAKIKTYETRINKLARNKKNDVSEMRLLLDDLKTRYDALKTASAAKIDEINATSVMDDWATANNLQEQLEDLLKMSIQSDLERQLRKGTTEKLRPIDIPEFEKQVLRAYRVANFYKRPPERIADFSSIVASSQVKAKVWKSYLALEQ